MVIKIQKRTGNDAYINVAPIRATKNTIVIELDILQRCLI